MKRTVHQYVGQLILIGICQLFLAGCFLGDEETSNKKLTKDFWLKWWSDKKDQHISCGAEADGNNGSTVVEPTVFAIGYDDNFIIAKQHPDKQKEIQDRLFNRDTVEKAYFLSDPADTIWLSKEDSIYKKNGKWFHISNGWNPPDSLKPYKRLTFFHIVDIRKYESPNWDSYKVYTFDNQKDFEKKRTGSSGYIELYNN